MRRVFFILLFAVIVQGYAWAAEQAHVTFYIQLVRGNSDSTPPTPGAKLIDPKLSQKLHPIFKWTNYWEIKRESVEVEAGKSARKRLSPDREVEIDLLKPQEIALRIYRDGKPSREMRQSATNPFFICGGDKEDDQSWFIVVQRDEPPQP